MKSIKKPHSACVIGAGCSIQNSGLGDEIDSCSDVVRVNGHKTNGHERDVGTKCTILCTFRCPTQFRVCLKIIKIMRELWVYIPNSRMISETLSRDNIRGKTALGMGDRLLEFNTQSFFIFGSPSWAKYPNIAQDKQNGEALNLLEYYKQQPHLSHTTLVRPSTGLMAIVMAIYRWGSISIAGFGKRDSVRLGYYDKKLSNVGIRDRKNNTVHNYEAERLLLNEWEKKGFIKRLDDPK